VAFSADGKHVLTGSGDHTAILWDAQTGQKLRTFQGHTDPVYAVAFSPDGKHVLTPSGAEIAILWDVQSGQKLRTFQGYTSRVSSVSFSPDGKHVLTHPGGGAAMVWEAQTGQKLRTFRGHTEGVLSGAFGPDGKHVLTGSLDKTAILWDTQTGQKLRTFQGHTGWVFSVSFSPDGKHVLTGSYDKTAILWDAQTGQNLRTFHGHTGRVFSVSFSPDGKHALTGSEDRTAMLWDAGSGEKLRTFQGHTGRVLSVLFSPDGKHALTGSEDNTAILWDAQTGQKLRTFQGHTGRVFSVSFSPDGKHILTCSADDMVRLWGVATGDELARLISLDAGRDWLVVTPEGLFDGSEGGRQKVSYRVGDRLSVVPVDRFFQDFYRPGLLAALMNGERPMPEVDFARQRPPALRITSPKEGVVDTPQVTLETQAVDQGGGVSGPWLVHNGARVMAAATTAKVGKVVKRSFTVALVQGDNKLEVKAASADGSWESEPARITLRYEKPLDKPELYVVAVGVSKYAADGLSLKFAAADAKAVADLFRKRGTALYRDVHPVVLLDGEATAAGIRKAFAALKAKARPQDTLVVFLAGHGTMIGQRYYFIPHEFKRSGAALEKDIRDQGLSHDALADLVEAVPALKRVLVLDTCASGGAVGLAKTARNPFALRGAVERLSRNRGVYAIAAAASTEEAQEVGELGHGVLTYALLAGLKAVDGGPLQEEWVRPGGAEPVVEVLEWFGFAAKHVPRVTKRYFGREQEVVPRTEGTSFPVLPLQGP
jgi:WD40 repeat protein